MENLIKIKDHSFFKGVYSGSGVLELHGRFEGALKINILYVKKTGKFIMIKISNIPSLRRYNQGSQVSLQTILDQNTDPTQTFF